MSEAYEQRSAVRALIVAQPQQRVLLIHMHVPDSGKLIWLAPGGGIEDGEDHEAALAREIYEETGLTGIVADGPVWTRRMTFRLHGARIDQSETYYLVRTALFDADNSANPAPLERSTFRGFRWWSLEEIQAATDQLFVPLNFAAYFARLLRDGIPGQPYDVGR